MFRETYSFKKLSFHLNKRSFKPLKCVFYIGYIILEGFSAFFGDDKHRVGPTTHESFPHLNIASLFQFPHVSRQVALRQTYASRQEQEVSLLYDKEMGHDAEPCWFMDESINPHYGTADAIVGL